MCMKVESKSLVKRKRNKKLVVDKNFAYLIFFLELFFIILLANFDYSGKTE